MKSFFSFFKNMDIALLKHKYHDIYLSYHKSQLNKCERIYTIFKSSGFRVWFDRNFLDKHGANGFDDPVSAIRRSVLFVMVQSREYIRSLKCRVELLTALEQRHCVINMIHDEEEDVTQTELVKSLIISNNGLKQYHEFRFNDMDLDKCSTMLLEKVTSEKLHQAVQNLHGLITYEVSNNQNYKDVLSTYNQSVVGD
jgi:hypothetical protein